MEHNFELAVVLSLLVVHLFPASSLIVTTDGKEKTAIGHLTASFGPQPGEYDVSARFVISPSTYGCQILNSSDVSGAIVLVSRGQCNFFDKIYFAQKSGAVGVVVGDNGYNSPAYTAMGANYSANVRLIEIPAAFIQYTDYLKLVNMVPLNATLNGVGEVVQDDPVSASPSVRTIGILLMILPVLWCAVAGGYYIRRLLIQRRAQRDRSDRVRHLPVTKYHPRESTLEDGDRRRLVCTNDSCAICLDDFQDQQEIKLLPCQHGFHINCIDPWINDRSDLCPICKRSILDAPMTRRRWFLC